jgi:hypothetical protein
VTREDRVRAAVLAVLPGGVRGRMHVQQVHLAVREAIADVTVQEVTAALLLLAGHGRVIRWTRFARPGQGGIERWYRAGAPRGAQAEPDALFP